MQVGGPGLSPTGIQGGHKLSNSFPAAPVACPPPPHICNPLLGSGLIFNGLQQVDMVSSKASTCQAPS